MSSWDFVDNTPVEPLDTDTRRRAALYVCGVTGNKDDARPLLEALGLVAPLVPVPRWRRAQ